MKIQTEKSFVIIIFACLQFLVLTALAMVFYSGGTRLNPISSGYQFFQNFFSDLGRIKAFSGRLNLISALLFIVAIFGLSFGVFIFFDNFPLDFGQNKQYSNIFHYSILGGKLAAVMLIGVALAPSDVLLIIHDIFVISGFSLIAIISVSLGILNYKEGFLSKNYSLLNFLLFIALILYGALFFFIPTITTTSHLIIRATTQKIIVYSLIGYLLLQNYIFWRAANSNREINRLQSRP